MNSGAIAEPYAATGYTAFVSICVGEAMKEAIESALTPRELARSRSVFEEDSDETSVATEFRSVVIAATFVALV